MANEPFRVLALDGGGIRGIFTAAVLAAIERELKVSLAAHVDLIVGTSTGGIIGLGLADGRSAEEMLGFYKSEGAAIFSRPRRWTRWWRPKYDRSRLDKILQEEFGDRTLNDLDRSVCVTAHELVAGTPRVWKDDHHDELSGGGDKLVWKVAAATAAAPTYFAPFQMGDQDSHVDGGLWANNPAMVGIVEAVRYAGRDLSDIRLLSIGTTSRTFRVPSHSKASRMGLLAWVSGARELLLGGSATMASDHQARLLLGDHNYLRLDSERSGDVALDDVEAAASLQELGEQVARTRRLEVKQLLGIAESTDHQ